MTYASYAIESLLVHADSTLPYQRSSTVKDLPQVNLTADFEREPHRPADVPPSNHAI